MGFAQGGLALATAAIAYSNLVGVRAAGAGCTDRIRVVPGNAGGSYLIAKLRNNGPICGAHMPFGGFGASGNGTREPGIEALDVYSELKNISFLVRDDQV